MGEINKSLTWNDLARDYNSCYSGRSAQSLPLDYVFNWAKKQEDKYKVTEDGKIHRTNGGNNGTN